VYYLCLIQKIYGLLIAGRGLKVYLNIIVMFSIYQEPVVIKDFITKEYCDKIIKISKPHLKSSTVSSCDIIDETLRKSKSVGLVGEFINKPIIERCNSILGHDKSIFEPLHIVKYEPGDFYNPHYDSSIDHVRPYTFIITLNDNYKGGETHFPNLNKTYKLEKGDALFFHNYTTDHLETKLSLHGGKEVLSGEKWIANMWINCR
jgi:prolyl 4-hydroxylase